MGLFSKNKGHEKVVWRNSKGEIRCRGNLCSQECDDTCPIYLNTIGLQHASEGLTQRAISSLSKAVEIAPDFGDAWSNLAAMKGSENNFSEALECYTKAHELNPNKLPPIFGLAIVNRDLHQYEEAIKWCDEYDRHSKDHKVDGVRNTCLTRINENVKKEGMETLQEVHINDFLATGNAIKRNYFEAHENCTYENYADRYCLKDINNNIDITEDEDEVEDDYNDYCKYEYDRSKLIIPDGSWVKRFIDEENPNVFYVLVITLDDCNVDKIICWEEHVEYKDCGYIFIPGMELPCTKTYKQINTPPERVIKDVDDMFECRGADDEFNIVGAKMPKALIEKGGVNGSKTEYSICRRSATRNAYSCLNLQVTEEGVITAADYTTYQSSVNPEDDLFTRPEVIDDRLSEIGDILISFVDSYDEDEYDDLMDKIYC